MKGGKKEREEKEKQKEKEKEETSFFSSLCHDSF